MDLTDQQFLILCSGSQKTFVPLIKTKTSIRIWSSRKPRYSIVWKAENTVNITVTFYQLFLQNASLPGRENFLKLSGWSVRSKWSWSDRPRAKVPLNGAGQFLCARSAFDFVSDQTQALIRPACAWMYSDQNHLRSKSFLIRLSSARNALRSKGFESSNRLGYLALEPL